MLQTLTAPLARCARAAAGLCAQACCRRRRRRQSMSSSESAQGTPGRRGGARPARWALLRLRGARAAARRPQPAPRRRPTTAARPAPRSRGATCRRCRWARREHGSGAGRGAGRAGSESS